MVNNQNTENAETAGVGSGRERPSRQLATRENRGGGI